MGRERGNAGRSSSPVADVADRLGRDPAALEATAARARPEERPGRTAADGDPLLERRERSPNDRDGALAASLSVDAQDAGLEVQVGEVET